MILLSLLRRKSWCQELSDDFQFPDTQIVSYQYGSDVSCWMESRSCNLGPVEGYSSGVGFYGTKGNLFLSGGNIYRICDYKGKVIKNVKSNLDFTGSITNPSEALDAFHFRNWFDGIRKGTRQNSPLREACMSTQLAQYGVIAQQVGHSLEIDPKTGKILHPTKEFKRLWSRKYEKGWEPEI